MRDYVSSLSSDGEVLVVEREVDPRFELAAVTDACQKQGDQAILFRKVRGTDFPVITNLYGKHERLCALIGAADGHYPRRFTELVKQLESGAGDHIERVTPASDLISGRLGDLPLVTYFEKDAAPYFTSAIFLANDPDSGVPNLSFHRSMYVSDSELRVRLGSSHDLARYKKASDARDAPLEAAMLIGAPPAVFVAAGSSLPIDADELQLAALIGGGKIAMRPCQTIDLEVPAATEIVIEGRFLANELREEGPFGEFMGYYVPVGRNAVFEISHVSWRDGALFHSLLCGSPEDMRLLEAAVAARIYGALQAVIPGVIDVACGPALLSTVIKIDKQYEGHGKHALLAAFGSHMDFNKMCMVVDEDIDVRNLDEVLWAYLTRGRADTRAMIIDDVPGFYRDDFKDHWGRLGIDATKPWGREAEFERKRIPGQDDIRLEDYLG